MESSKVAFLGGLAGFEIAGSHGQFVKVGEESGHVSGSGSRRILCHLLFTIFRRLELLHIGGGLLQVFDGLGV